MSRDNRQDSGQAPASVAKNIDFFRDRHAGYKQHVGKMDTYLAIRAAINDALPGIHRLLDIGNGGVFDYETTLVPSIVALDLFLEDLPASFLCPANVTLKTGDALAVPEPSETFDGVLMVMLLHHLVGVTPSQSLENAGRAVGEAFRVLRPGGKLIIVESCVPRWFYAVERALFPLASRAVSRMFEHPMTLQYPWPLIGRILEEHTRSVEVLSIPKGRWILQYGYKFPSILTPTNPYRFVASKTTDFKNLLPGSSRR